MADTNAPKKNSGGYIPPDSRVKEKLRRVILDHQAYCEQTDPEKAKMLGRIMKYLDRVFDMAGNYDSDHDHAAIMMLDRRKL
jgi:hypothetical protein